MTDNINSNSFASQWDATDIANLQPGHLARTKPVRAWERKPASPFTKQRLRVGKVWKRALPAARAGPSNATGLPEERTIKRLREGQTTKSPLKIVKRLCLGPNSGIGLQWDKVESPVKRITTRSAAASDLVALSEDEDDASSVDEEEDVEGTVIEYLDEDGTTFQQSSDQAQDDEGWSDVDAPASDGDEPCDDTTMHPGEAMKDVSLGDEPSRVDDLDTTLQTNDTTRANKDSATPHSESNVKAKPVSEELTPSLASTSHSTSLPAGFVSPVRRKRPVGRRTSTLVPESGRRRTLPRTFALNVGTVDETANSQDIPEAFQFSAGALSPPNPSSAAAEPPRMDEDDGSDMVADGESLPADEDEWEDLVNGAEAEEPSSLRMEGLREASEEKSMEFQGRDDDRASLQNRPVSPLAQSPSHQLDLPLRRSPRRSSTSPMKQRAFQAFTDAASHLVAFTPLKGMAPGSDGLSRQTDVDEVDSIHSFVDGSPMALERSASAPPEEPQMSPRRSAKPRVSDDTALLQAFLNRAAENKSTRRLSATKRESLSNRRDSDTVRQALASPLKPEILGPLDPNSPSPKKSLPAPEEVKPASIESMSLSSPSQDVVDSENSQGRTTRRSHREKRRVERAAPLAQTRISLRGNTEPVVLKRSEAQELATITRSNTRKNKGGSIMPALRLSKLIVEKPPIEGSPEIANEPANANSSRAAKRNIQWDETLVYYQEAPSEPEVQLFELGDSNTAPKLQSTSIASPTEAEENEVVPAPPPAAETPSKPKVRKLRAPRTASTPGKPAITPTAPQEPADSLPPLSRQKQPRRLRIATPAKGLDASSLLPADVAPAEQPAAATKPKAIPRKKATSRLPAPAPLPAATQEAQSLISSPPKKRAPSGLPPVKSFAPKLDFQTNLSAPRPADHAPESVGLMSPAKRAGKNVLFGNPPPAAPSFGQKAEQTGKAPGLSSPAKKRTRRAL
ncbi:hypothetical protein Q7P37_007916 [Cladosporium fusiforme]